MGFVIPLLEAGEVCLLKKEKKGTCIETMRMVYMAMMAMKTIQVRDDLVREVLKEEVLEMAMIMTEVGLVQLICHMVDLLPVKEILTEEVLEMTMKTIEVDLAQLIYHMDRNLIMMEAGGMFKGIMNTKVMMMMI